MGEFDKVRRLYQEHQNNIYDKLVEIMSLRAATHAKTMRALDWDAPADDEPTVHPYMETLTKETLTLYKNLIKLLPEGTVQFIMKPVFASYSEQLGKVLIAAEVRTEAGRNSILHDLEHFKNKLSKIEGNGDTADYLISLATKKNVAQGGGDGKKPGSESSEAANGVQSNGKDG
ncbi:hypothetical protein MAPG_01838 [Magnaporthiopsis poae ATCC 64411]|uniref:Vacuolar protein sorting-associated protein 54 C-terminal domain-containing protein n=1 Tax=Magnaporthiopsis poae (strain ATCC 64411 / 73-15) TaxID=644358 RepID=A0A0C4DPR6_MAGP6|nr:hypothetical protein MAPG_01838 [Magnaporthiopsis poae ATCC 64411]